MKTPKEIEAVEVKEHGFHKKAMKYTTCIKFSLLKEEIGALAKALQIFQENFVNLNRIESVPSKRNPGENDFMVECDTRLINVTTAIEALKKICIYTKVISGIDIRSGLAATPWFPLSMKDLDKFTRGLTHGPDLETDHPGYNDPIYRARRRELSAIACSYKHGQKMATIKYSPQELQTWKHIFRRVTKLYPTHACSEYLSIFPALVESCGYHEDNIPQLQDVSDFLKQRTGFTLRPATGLLSPRDFLAGLAFRVIQSTQYIRHHSTPRYTPEPDICHDLLGHIPLLADPDFADFSQDIGLASLGAPDDEIEKLAAIYWFTAEFGLCRQDGKLKAYGAGVLSSYGELEHSLSGKSLLKEFDPVVAGAQEYPTNGFQPVYFVVESFHDAKAKFRSYALNIDRPFSIHYNSYSNSVDVLEADP